VGANLAVRRSVFDHLCGFTPHLGRSPGTLLCGEDHDFCQRAAAAGYRCEYRPELRARHWVPAERTRLTYYLRWFFWSGVTNARLDRRPGTGGGDTAERVTSAHFVRRLVLAPVRALRGGLAGQPGDAVRAATDGAFALGVLSERIRHRVCGENVPRAAHEQASAVVR
jgi:GT2 family glycosyltransferase